MSRAPRFESIQLDYGCHHARYRLPGAGRPTVVVGSNGTGKSTLVEALVRTLFGFNRREPEARRLQDRRRPWKAGAFKARLVMEDSDGRLAIERDFETNEVVVTRLSNGEEMFRGEPNPAAPSSADQRSYQELLERLIGLAELRDYERTSCVQQGQMLETELTQDLLRIAAGGHADVEAARAVVLRRYYDLTRAPISSVERRRQKNGLVERLEAERDQLTDRISAVQRAEAERAPLLSDLETAGASLARLRVKERRLERERAALSRLHVLQEREQASLQCIARLEEVQADLREAIWKAESADKGTEPGLDRDAYPEDYLERLAALEEGLWPRLHRLQTLRDSRSAPPAEVTGRMSGVGRVALWGVGLVVVGAVVALVGSGALRAAGLVALLAGAATIAMGFRRGIEARRAIETEAVELRRIVSEVEALERRIADRLEGMPDARGISPQTLSERRREFAAWRSHRDEVAETSRLLAEAMRRARRALRSEASELSPAAATSSESADSPEPSLEEARTLQAELDQAVSGERNDNLAPTRLQLEQARSEVAETAGDAQVPLQQAETELERARRELTEHEGEERDLQQRLMATQRPQESSLMLAEQRAAREEELGAAKRAAGAYRRAYGLLADAYEEFRKTDQERLIACIGGHLKVLGGGRMGPLVVPANLDSAGLLYAGRTLPLTSPPLSYGELHVAFFAVRMGAADFLSGLGVRLPLIVDDPFVHLDSARSEELWEVLCTIASDRQVVLTTQDRLILEHLDITPDLDLDGPGREASPQMELPVDTPGSS